MKKILILLFVVLILPVISFAYDYEIKSYNVDMVVNENNVFDITEKISTILNVNKHGIFRKLPLRNTVERLDGTVSQNRAKVSNISVNEPFSLSRENGYKIIKIGDTRRTIKGVKDYTIKYSYDIGKDTSKDYDELYFNITGNEWDTTIENLSFNITMPKEFDKEKVGFSVGQRGSVNSNGIEYSVNGNTITGSYAGKLNPREGLTIRLELPEGYFLVTKKPIDTIIWIVPIFFTIIAIALWYKFGKDEKPIETVEFYPPDNLNSAEIGYLYKGQVENKDIVSLLIYLANKGYLKIAEVEQSGLFVDKKTFKIIKLKEYDGDNEVENMFFKSLFKKEIEMPLLNIEGLDDTINEERNCVYESELRNSFYMTLLIIARMIKKAKNKVFDRNASIAKIISIFMSISAFLLITVSIISNNLDDIKVFTLGIICVVIMSIFSVIMRKRTKYGTEILGRIRGFKSFLRTAEKEKLESLVMENPAYFYDILPYTYVLGVSNKWINKFESIAYEAPKWYEGNNTFTVATFGSFMNNTMRDANSAMTSSPSSSSSGGFGGGSSGGGFSGGGSGGGGGGSW